MGEKRVRRFPLIDAMVLIAAVALSLIPIRVGLQFGFFELGRLTESGGRSATLARQLVEFLNFGGGCLLAGLVPAVWILGMVRADPSRKEAARGPGLVACSVALVAATLPIGWFLIRVWQKAGPPTWAIPWI